jgi:hypothetical protein
MAHDKKVDGVVGFTFSNPGQYSHSLNLQNAEVVTMMGNFFLRPRCSWELHVEWCVTRVLHRSGRRVGVLFPVACTVLYTIRGT